MKFLCDSKYIILPASHNSEQKRLLFYIEGKLVYDLLVALDYDAPQYHFPVNVERFEGREITVECKDGSEIKFETADEYPFDHCGTHRPVAHFTTKCGWINDPNGLTFYKGKYLMYYQHNPVATTWENMHWGSAESTDLVHWIEHDDVLFPDENGTIFSGSAIVDKNNLTGLKKGDEDTILYFYTCAGGTSEASKGKPFTQNLAYSNDGGRTLTKYHKPLIEQIARENRDPKVVCYEPGNFYVIPIFLENHEFAFFKSTDLLNWTEFQRIEMSEDAECPDFYPLTNPDTGKQKWVLSAASDRYYIGEFDGEKFTPETPLMRLNYGNSSYAAQTWSDLPEGRRVRTAFAGIVIPGMPFSSCMNIPQEMTLKNIDGSLKLCAWPVKEIENLYSNTWQSESAKATPQAPFEHKIMGRACDVSLEIACKSDFSVTLYGMKLQYDFTQKLLKCNDKEAPVKGKDGKVALRIIFDTIYTEIFADEGSVFMGMSYTQDVTQNMLTISSDSSLKISISVSELESFYK